MSESERLITLLQSSRSATDIGSSLQSERKLIKRFLVVDAGEQDTTKHTLTDTQVMDVKCWIYLDNL
jgi:hypothetical protein